MTFNGESITVSCVDTPGLEDNRKIPDLDVYATLAIETSFGMNLALYIIDAK